MRIPTRAARSDLHVMQQVVHLAGDAVHPGLLPGGPKVWACRGHLHSLSSLHQGCTTVLQIECFSQSACLMVFKNMRGS